MSIVLNGTTGITTPDVTSDSLTVDSTTLVVDEANNRVGIGTSSPSANNIVTISGATPNSKLLLTGGTTQNGLTFGSAGGGNQFYLYSQSGGLAVYDETAATERARITADGDLMVGKTATSISTLGAEIRSSGLIASTLSGSTSATSTLEVFSTGASAYRFFVGMNGTVYATNTTISALSDQRHKENVRDLDAGLAEVMALKPRLYDWKEGKGADIKNARGFIAQEFEEVFPDLIDEWKDPAPEGEEPYKSVRADLIPVLVKAIQEQQAIIEALTARVSALEAS